MAKKTIYRTEDQVRDSAKIILGFDAVEAKIRRKRNEYKYFKAKA